MLYTVSEVSDLTNLSKVSIYNKLKLKQIQGHISKNQGITYIDEEGLNLIKDSLSLKENDLNNLNDNKDDTCIKQDIPTDDDNLNLKSSYINTLKEQLKIKDIQIQELNNRLAAEQELSKNRQILELKQQPKQDIKALEEHFNELDNRLVKLKDKLDNRKKQSNKLGLFKRLLKKD